MVENTEQINVIVSQEPVDVPGKPWLKIPGATTEQELDWLHMNAYNKNLIYEIGSFIGRSTVALLESGSKVVAVDDFIGMREEHMTDEFRETIYHQFVRNTNQYNNLAILKCDHADIVIPEECDMIFIDGSHHYDHVIRDIQKVINRKNILICGHDFFWWNSVKEAVYKSFPHGFGLIGANLWVVKQ